jgi:hypothetical protein
VAGSKRFVVPGDPLARAVHALQAILVSEHLKHWKRSGKISAARQRAKLEKKEADTSNAHTAAQL